MKRVMACVVALLCAAPVIAIGVFLWLLLSTPIPDSEPLAYSDYHTAADLQRISRTEFPPVTIVDSILYNWAFTDCNFDIVFKADNPLDTTFFERLEQECLTRPCSWTKDSLDYHFNYDAELKENHRAIVGHPTCQIVSHDRWEPIGSLHETHVGIKVPFRSDTITLSLSFY